MWGEDKGQRSQFTHFAQVGFILQFYHLKDKETELELKSKLLKEDHSSE